MDEASSSHRPRTLVVRTAGINCDEELVRAFELAGADVEMVHIDTLCREPQRLSEAAILALPGGFSYGDDIASGRILAMRLRTQLGEALRHAAADGLLIIGICNGFQALVQAGLLPDPASGSRSVALVVNESGRFVDDWSPMVVDRSSPCVWTRGLGDGLADPGLLTFPVAHGEGRFVATPDTLVVLQDAGLVPLRYGRNLNGSIDGIAGLTDRSGRILGLMPHPERFLDWNRHPHWTRLPAEVRRGPTPGLRLFQNAVEAARSAAVSAV